MKNFYELLNVSENASYSDIKMAYRRLAVRYHPDKNPNNPHAEELFKQINVAYDTLSSPAKKSRYDATLSYQQFQTFSKQTTTYTRPAATQYKAPKQTPYYRKGSWLNLNNKNFIIVLTISCVLVFGVIGIANYAEHLEYEAKREKALALHTTYLALSTLSSQQLANGEYENSIKTANLLTQQLPEYYDAHAYKRDLINDIKKQGINRLEIGEYGKAIPAFLALVKLGKLQDQQGIFNYYLGLAYSQNNQPKEAIEKLSVIETNEYPEIPTLLAVIYRDQLQDTQQAVVWHKRAKVILGTLYKNVGFQFTPADAPEEHFNAYYQSAITNYGLKEYATALQDLRGALFLRSSNKDALYMKGLCELELGLAEACNSFEKAKKNGHFFVDEVIGKRCR